MALITKSDLVTLDVTFLGQPFVQVTASTVDTLGLDVSFQGQPFVVVASDGGAGPVIVNASGSWSSTCAVACTISNIRGADLEAFSNASLTATGKLTKYDSASMTSAFTHIANVERTRSTTSEQSTVFSVDALATILVPTGTLKEFAATLDSAFTSSILVNRLLVDTSSQSSTFTQDVDYNRIRETSVSVSTEFLTTDTINKIAGTTATLDSSIDLSADTSRIREFALSLTTQADLTSTISNIRGADLVAFNEATLTANVDRVVEVDSAQFVEFTQFVSAGLGFEANAQLDATSQQVTDVTKTSTVISSLDSQVQLDIDYLRYRDGQAQLDLTATLDSTVQLSADRSSNMSAEFAQTIDYERYRTSSISLSNEFTQTTTISNIAGADLQAFTDAQLTADISVIKQGDLQLAVEFTTLILADVTIGGFLYEFESNMVSEFTKTLSVKVTRDFESSQVMTSVMDPDGVTRIRDNNIDAVVAFEQTAVNYRIVQGACDFASLFSPSASIDGVKNTFAVLDSTSALAAVAIANRSADIALSSIVNQSLQGDRIRDYASTMQSQFAVTATVKTYSITTASLTSQFTQSTLNDRLRKTHVGLNLISSAVVDVVRRARTPATLTSQFTLVSRPRRIKQFAATMSAFVSTLTTAQEIVGRDFFLVGLDVTPYDSSQALQSFTYDSDVDAAGNIYGVGIESYDRVSQQDPAEPPAWGFNNPVQRIILTKHSPRGRLLWQKRFEAPTGANVPKITVVGDYANIVYGTETASWNGSAVVYSRTLRAFQVNLLTQSATWGRFISTTSGPLIDTNVYNGESYFMNGGYTTNWMGAGLYKLTNSGDLYTFAFDKTGEYAPNEEVVFDVTANGIYVGISYNSGFGAIGGAFGRLNLSNGQLSQAREIYDFEPHAIRSDASGNMYVAGRYGLGAAATYVMMKLDSNFNIIWSKKDYASYTNRVKFVLNSNNDLVCAFGTIGSGGGSNSLQLISGTTGNRLGYGLFDNPAIKIKEINIDTSWVQISASDGTSSELIYAQVPETLNFNSFTTPTVSWSYSPSGTTYANIALTIVNATNIYAPGFGAPTAPSMGTPAISTSTYTEQSYFSRILSGPVPLSSEFAITAKNTRTRRTTMSAAIVASIHAHPQYTATIDETLTATAQVVTTGRYVRGITKTLSVVASVTSRPLRIKQLSSALTSNAQVFVEAQRIRGGDAISLNTEIHQTADLGLIKRTPVQLQAFDTVVEAVTKIGRGIVQCDVVSTMLVSAVKTVGNANPFDVELTQVTEAVKTARAQLNIESRSQVSAFADKIKSPEAFMLASFTQVVDNNRLRDNNVVTASEFNNVTVAVKTPAINVQAQAAFTTNFGDDVRRLRLASSSQQAFLTSNFTVRKIVYPELNFEAIATEMVVGNIIAFDQQLMLHIPYEYRTLLIPEEYTLLMVPTETRVNMVRKISQ